MKKLKFLIVAAIVALTTAMVVVFSGCGSAASSHTAITSMSETTFSIVKPGCTSSPSYSHALKTYPAFTKLHSGNTNEPPSVTLFELSTSVPVASAVFFRYTV